MINLNPTDAKEFLIANNSKSCCVRDSSDKIEVYYNLTDYYLKESVTSSGEKDYCLLSQEEFHKDILNRSDK